MQSGSDRPDGDAERRRRPRRAAGRGSGAAPPPRDGRWTAAGSRARAGRDRRPSSSPPPPPARRPAGDGRSAPSGASGVPRRSRRARGAGTTRRQSAPGRGAAEGPARCSAAPAASHPRRGRCRAGSCAPPRGAGRRRRRRGSRRPPRHRVAPVRSDRHPRLPPYGRPTRSGIHRVWAPSTTGDSLFAPAPARPALDLADSVPDRFTRTRHDDRGQAAHQGHVRDAARRQRGAAHAASRRRRPRSRGQLGGYHRNYVDGAWRDGVGTFEVRSPIDTRHPARHVRERHAGRRRRRGRGGPPRPAGLGGDAVAGAPRDPAARRRAHQRPADGLLGDA